VKQRSVFNRLISAVRYEKVYTRSFKSFKAAATALRELAGKDIRNAYEMHFLANDGSYELNIYLYANQLADEEIRDIRRLIASQLIDQRTTDTERAAYIATVALRHLTTNSYRPKLQPP
jgi:hypothetical protein